MYRFLCVQIFLFLLDLYLRVECLVIQWLYVCHFGELPEFHLKFQSYILLRSSALFPEQANLPVLPSNREGYVPRLCLVQSEVGGLLRAQDCASDFPSFCFVWSHRNCWDLQWPLRAQRPGIKTAPIHALHEWGTPVNLPIQKLQARSRCWSLCRNTLQIQGCVSNILFSPRMRGEEDRIPSL